MEIANGITIEQFAKYLHENVNNITNNIGLSIDKLLLELSRSLNKHIYITTQYTYRCQNTCNISKKFYEISKFLEHIKYSDRNILMFIYKYHDIVLEIPIAIIKMNAIFIQSHDINIYSFDEKMEIIRHQSINSNEHMITEIVEYNYT